MSRVSLEFIFSIAHLRAIPRGEKPTSAINNVYRSDRCNFTDATGRWHRAKVQASRRDGEAPNRFIPKRISRYANGGESRTNVIRRRTKMRHARLQNCHL